MGSARLAAREWLLGKQSKVDRGGSKERRQVVYLERVEVLMFQGSTELKEKCIIASN